jgi:hypothetical protein
LEQLRILIEELHKHINFYKLIGYTYLHSRQCIVKVWYSIKDSDGEWDVDEQKYIVTFKNDSIEKVEEWNV